MGALAVNKTLPAFPDGHITKWLTVLDDVAKIDAETIVPGHGPVGGKTEFAEAQALMALLNSEIRRGFDAGLAEEATAKAVNLGQFTSFLGQDRIRLITHMAYLAYRGELQ